MLEYVNINNIPLAIIIRHTFNKRGANFITSKKSPFQIGVSQYKKNTNILPHFHKKPLRHIRSNQEIIYVVKGKIKVDLFIKNRKVVTKILKSGDMILLMTAHGFTMIADTKIFEVKQGPYIDKKSDKGYLKLK